MIQMKPKETKSPNSVIRLFGYWSDPKNRIFGYSVIRVTGITKFGNSGHPKKTEETEFGDNLPKPLGSLAKKWNLC
jgi:hypothetical protein